MFIKYIDNLIRLVLLSQKKNHIDTYAKHLICFVYLENFSRLTCNFNN